MCVCVCVCVWESENENEMRSHAAFTLWLKKSKTNWHGEMLVSRNSKLPRWFWKTRCTTISFTSLQLKSFSIMSNCCQRDSLSASKRRQRQQDALCRRIHLLSHVLFANQPCQSLASFSSWKPLTPPLTLPRTQHRHHVNVPSGFKWVSTVHIGLGSLFACQSEESWACDSPSWCFFCLVHSLLDHHICAMADQVLVLNAAKVAFTPGFYAFFFFAAWSIGTC